MHRNMTPWRNCRLAVFGIGISIILFAVICFVPFYSYTYFFQGKVMSYTDVANANHQILIPYITIIVCLVLQVVGICFMLFLNKKKVFRTLGSTFSFIAAFASLGILLISVCRLWVIPYEFEYFAEQKFEIGYILYILFLLFNGVLGCYMTAISGKVEEIS